MITAVFLIFFLEQGTVQVIADQAIFSTMEECELYAENAKADQQQKVLQGLSDPHTALHTCVNWGTDA